MSHTPGPWKLNFSNAEPAVTDYDNVMIAIVTTDEDKPQETEEVLANGRLIAAAPELLAALKMADDCIWGDVSEVAAWLSIAKSAIKKAEGRANE